MIPGGEYIMDISALMSYATDAVSPVTKAAGASSAAKGAVDGNLFDSILNSAIDNLNKTNQYLSDSENEKIRFSLGETENTHDLTIALQKASAALQYTVAVRDKFLEAYKEIMNMQI